MIFYCVPYIPGVAPLPIKKEEGEIPTPVKKEEEDDDYKDLKNGKYDPELVKDLRNQLK